MPIFFPISSQMTQHSLASKQGALMLSLRSAKPLAGQGQKGKCTMWGQLACSVYLCSSCTYMCSHIPLEHTCLIHMLCLPRTKQGTGRCRHKAWKVYSWTALVNSPGPGSCGIEMQLSAFLKPRRTYSYHVVHARIWITSGKDFKILCKILSFFTKKKSEKNA